MKILLTGATGFVGQRLLPRLLQSGYTVRCALRDASSEKAKTLGNRFEHFSRVEFVEADATNRAQLREALSGCDAAYYLIHSMGKEGHFRELDRQCAENFLSATEGSSCERVVYLSGLADEYSPCLSEHLASRIEVGRILRSGSATCFEFRAAMIIGADSLSFRLVKHLCHRLPVMLCPKWLQTRTQPLAIDDLLNYLVRAIELKQTSSDVFEIGGADSATYLDILKEYCRQKQLSRMMIPVPLLSPKLSSLWLRLVTPETADVGKDLIDGLRNENLVRTRAADRTFRICPMTISKAISIAISRENLTQLPPAQPQLRTPMVSNQFGHDAAINP